MLFKQTFIVPKPSYYVEVVSAFILSTWEAEMEISLVYRASFHGSPEIHSETLS